jgi:predicted nucleic acid-binding protein
MAKNILADSGFWFGLFYPRDSYHKEACSIEASLAVSNLLIPWPSLYETLNTRLMRRSGERERFRHYLRRRSTVLLDDEEYKAGSLAYVLEQRSTNLSLVDHIIRSMLEDRRLAIDALITFNAPDFSDVCQSRGIEIVHS